MSNNYHLNELLIGALVGGLIVGGSSLLSGRLEDLKEVAGDKLDDFKDIAERLFKKVNKKRKKLSGYLPEDTDEWKEKILEYISTAKEEIGSIINDPEYKELRNGLLIGIILGSLFGAGTFTLLGKNENHKTSKSNVFNDLIDLISCKCDAVKNGGYSKSFDDFANLAFASMRLWKNLKSK